jgi:hypothetical protein
MTPEDRKVFFVDPKTFTWKQVVEGYFYGFMKYMQKEDVIYPDGQVQLLLNKNHLTYFENLRRAFIEQTIVTKDPARIRKDTMNHLATFLEQQLAKPQASGTQAPTKAALQSQAAKYVAEIEANISPFFIRSSMYFFLKAWEKLFTNIMLNSEGL